MIKSVRYRVIELFISFVLVPISFALDYPFWAKFSIGLLGFFYVIFILLRVKKNKFKVAPNLPWKSFWIHTCFKFFVIIVLTISYVLMTDADALFHVVSTKPKKWILIIGFYTFFSVYPQELLYRTLFFQRYASLINKKKLVIFINAVIFSLGHIFYRNALVIVVTFLGGLLFAHTYSKTKSTLLVSIEHAIYGSWLYTVGMGAMLGFPD